MALSLEMRALRAADEIRRLEAKVKEDRTRAGLFGEGNARLRKERDRQRVEVEALRTSLANAEKERDHLRAALPPRRGRVDRATSTTPPTRVSRATSTLPVKKVSRATSPMRGAASCMGGRCPPLSRLQMWRGPPSVHLLRVGGRRSIGRGGEWSWRPRTWLFPRGSGPQ